MCQHSSCLFLCSFQFCTAVVYFLRTAIEAAFIIMPFALPVQSTKHQFLWLILVPSERHRPTANWPSVALTFVTGWMALHNLAPAEADCWPMFSVILTATFFLPLNCTFSQLFTVITGSWLNTMQVKTEKLFIILCINDDYEMSRSKCDMNVISSESSDNGCVTV